MTSYCVCIRYSATETKEAVRIWYTPVTDFFFRMNSTGTCFIQKIYAPSSSLLQGKYLPFSPSPLRLNNFRLFVILSLTQLYRYTPEIFLFSTAPLRRIGQEYSANVALSTLQSLKRIALDFSYAFRIL
jgi:hypothetical protein